jgi:hypothetical protein
VLHGDLCIVNFGPGPRSFLVALDKRTGKEAWRTEVTRARDAGRPRRVAELHRLVEHSHRHRD